MGRTHPTLEVSERVFRPECGAQVLACDDLSFRLRQQPQQAGVVVPESAHVPWSGAIYRCSDRYGKNQSMHTPHGEKGM